MILRLENAFHKTCYDMFVEGLGDHTFSARTYRRIRAALCGVEGCRCGDALHADSAWLDAGRGVQKTIWSVQKNFYSPYEPTTYTIFFR